MSVSSGHVPEARRWWSLFDTADRLGRLRWFELALFGLLGSAARRADDAELKLFMVEAARHHAEHADWLARRMPTVADVTPDNRTAPASAELAAVLASAGDVADAADLLTLTHRVLIPALVDAYADHLAACSEVADSAVMRTLERVVADLAVDRRRAEELIDRRSGGSAAGAVPGSAADLASAFALTTGILGD